MAQQQKLYVDISRNTYQVTRGWEPKVDMRTGVQRQDRFTQEPLNTVELLSLATGGGGEVLTVTLAGLQPELTVGQMVTPVDLEAIPWVQGDRNGVAFRAKSLTPLGHSAQHSSSKSSAA
jgi:hypothetical protein